MQPQIDRALLQGFRSANRSWPGVGVTIAGWCGIGLIALILSVAGVLGLAIARPIAESFRPAPPVDSIAPSASSESPAAADPEQPAETIPPQPTANTAESRTLFDQLKVGRDLLPPQKAEHLRRQFWDHVSAQAVQAAHGRLSGLIGVVAVFFLTALGVYLFGLHWLLAGQIGYVAEHVRTGQLTLSTFWNQAWRHWLSLLGIGGLWVLLYLAIGVIVLVGVLGVWFARAVLPLWSLVLLVAGAIMGLLVGLIWIGVRQTFWAVAAVVDSLGPMAAWKASWQATQGRWWRTFGLGLVLASLYGVVLMIAGIVHLFGLLVTALGAPILGVLIMLFRMMLQVLAGLYLSFVMFATLVRFYEDTKSAMTAPAAGQAA